KLPETKLKKMSLGAFLETYLKTLEIPRATYTVRPDYVEITAKPQAAGEPTADSAEKIVAALQNSRVSYEKDLKSTPFQEVLQDLAKRYDIIFVVNKTAIVDVANQLDTSRAENLSVSRMDGLTLAWFLNVYFRALPVPFITYLIRPNHIEITTVQAAQKESGLQEAIDE